MSTANILTRRNPLFHRPPDASIPQPPLATDPAAVSAADPFRDFWRFERKPQRVRTSVQVDKFILAHYDICADCRTYVGTFRRQLTAWRRDRLVKQMHSILHPECYAHHLFHSLAYGHMPAFRHLPPKFDFANYPSVFSGGEGMRMAWIKQLKLPWVFHRGKSPMYVSPLVGATRRSLATGDVAYRVCFDASRELNDRIEKWPIRYADLNHILMLMRDHDWVSSIDLSSFYLHLPLHRLAQDYLQLRDPFSGELLTYAVIPFGITSAPAFASMVSAVVLKILKHRALSLGPLRNGPSPATPPAWGGMQNDCILRRLYVHVLTETAYRGSHRHRGGYL